MQGLAKEKHKVRSGCPQRLPSTTDFQVTGTYVGYMQLHDTNAYIDAIVALEAGVIGSGSISIKPVNSDQRPYISPSATQMVEKVEKYLNLTKNWDGQDGIAPEREVVNSAVAFIIDMDQKDLPLFFTAPGPNGEIIVEFKKGELAAEVLFESGAETEMILYSGREQTYMGALNKKELERLFA